jgi:VWFA-related protein
VILAVSASIWLNAQTAPPVTSQQTFRTATDLVAVDVSVRRGNRPVTGLTATDFDLRDNGVRQRVESVEIADVPIDLSIVVDLSGNPDRPVGMPPPATRVAAALDTQARQLTPLLRTGDRVRLVALDTYVQQVWPLQPVASLPRVGAVQFDGHAALYNTLAMLLLQPVEPTRRHVIVLDTKGLDSVSAISAADVRRLAEQSDAQLHVVTREVDADAESTVRRHQCLYMDRCWPSTRFWTQPRRRLFNAIPVTSDAPRRLYPDGIDIKTGARATGGDLYQGVNFSEPTPLNTFEHAFEHFRQSYVLRYRPAGVTRSGWHRITVTVPSDPSLKIHARSGYAIDATPPPAAAPPPISDTMPLRTLDDLLDAYARGAYLAIARHLRGVTNPSGLIDDFVERGNPWPGSPRREALFALELAEAGLFSSNPQARQRARQLLDRFGRLVRHPLGPDAFERAWLLAQVTMLQATIRPAEVRPYIDRAIARFPDEPRFQLARAVLTDQSWPASSSVAATPEHIATMTAQFEALLAFPDTRADAALRLGWFLHRIGRSDQALAKFALLDRLEQTDPYAAYLRDLLQGHVLLALDRHADALAAYQRARRLRPEAPSARVAEMSALLLSGDRASAETMAESIETSSAARFDPWWLYWQGDYRRYPDAIDAARRMIQ